MILTFIIISLLIKEQENTKVIINASMVVLRSTKNILKQYLESHQYRCAVKSLLLNMVRVSVPSYRVRGQSAQLECGYELGHDSLYSVKWYRDNEEFYRYIPKFDPPKHAYKLEGIKVDLSKSNDRTVILNQVTLKSSGVYRCEVSAEAPSFDSAAAEGTMEVIYLPREGPKIIGNEQENRRGDTLFLNCTSGRSYPAAVLSWDIDGEKVTDPSLLVEYPVIQHAHGLQSVALGLRVPLRRSMQVRCTARVAPAWREGSEAVVAGTQLSDSKEAMLLVRSSSNLSGHNILLIGFIFLIQNYFFFVHEFMR